MADRAPTRPLISLDIAKRLGFRGKDPLIDSIYWGLCVHRRNWYRQRLGGNTGR